MPSVRCPQIFALGVGVLALLLFEVSGLPEGTKTKPGDKDSGNVSKADTTAGYDDTYVTKAATGEKIPHPLSKKTTVLRNQGKSIKIPEGMVYVPEGEFVMGRGKMEHKVYLDAYFIGKYEVTNAEWKAFTDATRYTPLPVHWKGGEIPQDRENHPVVNASWNDTQKYCEWVNKETGRSVRLPTEAQWEKAARGPKAYLYPWGSAWDYKRCNNKRSFLERFGFPSDGDGKDIAAKDKMWRGSEKGKETLSMGGGTTPVGSFPRGKSWYGCHDMAGNVWDMCSDWFRPDYVTLKDALKNPQGPSEEEAEGPSKVHVTRGGAWADGVFTCTNLYRWRAAPDGRGPGGGLRIAEPCRTE